jgi:hypothetical protein
LDLIQSKPTAHFVHLGNPGLGRNISTGMRWMFQTMKWAMERWQTGRQNS